jgi:hypothetical protein
MLMLKSALQNKPTSRHRKVVVTSKSKSQLSAPGGGYAVSIIEIK